MEYITVILNCGETGMFYANVDMLSISMTLLKKKLGGWEDFNSSHEYS